MRSSYIIASDLGSQSIKTSLFDSDGDLVCTTNTDTQLHSIGNGSYVYKGEEFYELVLDNIKAVMNKSGLRPSDVAALSFCGMGGGIIGVDQNWIPTTDYSNPLDTRDHPVSERIMEKFSNKIRSFSGTGAPMGANKIVWIKDRFPDAYANTQKFMMVTQYVQGKLAATSVDHAFWERTSTTLSGLADARSATWSEEICSLLDIDMSKLPRIVEPTEIIGSLSKQAASQCGLIQGIPIVAGAFDKPCDQLGSGANVVGAVVDNAATYPALTACVDHFTPDIQNQTLECCPSAQRGLWIVMTYITGGGLTHRWFAENILQLENYADPFAHLDEEAGSVPPGSEGLLFIPHLGGRATPYAPDVRGGWIGFNWNHAYPHFYRSILESIAYDHASTLSTIKKVYRSITFNEVKVLGGGCVSNLWNQIKADVLGIPYICLNRNETTTLGAAIIGGAAVGLFKDMQGAAESFTEPRATYHPRDSYHQHYRNYTKLYSELYQFMNRIFKDLAQIRKIPVPPKE